MQKGIYLLLLGILLFGSKSYAQIVPRVAGLERDSVYMALLTEEHALQHSQDSLQGLITENRRRLLASDANRDQYSAHIMTLEGQLFDIRNRLGIITSDMNGMEQDFIIKNMNNNMPVTQVSVADIIASSNLLRANFFKENISAEDLQVIRTSKEREVKVKALATDYAAVYQMLKVLNTSYLEAETKTASDSIRQQSIYTEARLTAIQDSMYGIWNPLFTEKIDNFNILLDKLNVSSAVLDPLNERSRELRNNEGLAHDKFQSVEFAIFPEQHNVVMLYELALAKELKSKLAQDSLMRTMSQLNLHQYEFEKLIFPEREFTAYADLKIGGTGIHSLKNPIPEHETPKLNDLYKIRIGTYSKAPAVSVFRNIHPLTSEVLEDGKIAYYAGAYKTYEQAQVGYERLRKLGMKVQIVGWSKGAPLPEPKAEPKSGEATTGESIYKIEFVALTPVIKEMIDLYAPEKEISKIDRADGTSVFSLGSFEKRSEAETIANKIGESAKVVEIQI